MLLEMTKEHGHSDYALDDDRVAAVIWEDHRIAKAWEVLEHTAAGHSYPTSSVVEVDGVTSRRCKTSQSECAGRPSQRLSRVAD